jgi:hypothetical protein
MLSNKSPDPTGIGRFSYVREEFWFHRVFGLPVAQLFSLGHFFMRKYFGRLFGEITRGSARHLLDIAPLLGFSAAELSRLSGVKGDAREALFLSLIERRHGGTVDWRGTPHDIYDVLLPCLTAEERARLPDVASVETAPPAQVVQTLSAHFANAPRTLRAMESFGDFIIVLLLPRERVAEFDRVAANWIA